jgi:hypothetical protein
MPTKIISSIIKILDEHLTSSDHLANVNAYFFSTQTPTELGLAPTYHYHVHTHLRNHMIIMLVRSTWALMQRNKIQ